MIWIFCLLILMSSTACQPAEVAKVAGEEAEPILHPVASLDGVELHEEQFEEYLALAQGELYDDPMAAPPKRELFREFVVRNLLLKEAQKEEFTVTDQEVNELLSIWLNKDREKEEELLSYIRDYLVTQGFLHKKIQSDCEVSLGEMQAYYDAHHDEFIVEDQVHVLEIVVNSREEIETLANLTESAETRTFMEVARQRSIGITGPSGGDLGFFSRGQLPENFENVVFALQPGEISEPIESIRGFHLFMVEEWLPRHAQKFYEVRDEIFRELVASKERVASETFINELLEKTEIEIYDESLEFRDREKKTDD